MQLRVKATATPLQVKPGEKVAFSAAVEGVGSGEQVSYSWTFGDGQRLTDADNEVSHGFAKQGSYAVLVGVTTPGNETGASAVVRIQVGKPSQGGPNREGGGTNDAKGAPDQGAAAGPAGGSTGSGSSSASIPPPATSFPEPDPAPAPATETQPPVETQPAPEPEGEEVSGLLIGNTATAAPEEAEPAQQAAARTGTPSDEDGGGGGLPAAAWGILAGAGLLGAGALTEAAGGLGGVFRLRGRLAP